MKILKDFKKSIFLHIKWNWNINTKYIEVTDTPTGHAIIQVNKKGENSITLYSGANSTFTAEDIENILCNFSKDDYLLIQNEINNISVIIKGTSLKTFK